ncbi:HIT family protein [Schaalia sp. ZJ1691]|uniref:HIT family protein n=1 Tax=Schaalia sp. ZJ1691 TaxID=2709404 RepID=UPI0013ECFCA3|nr:HIT family protein [Schaalia sp. ZJ1691]
MTTVFHKIITGEFPGRFVWADDICVAFATIEPTSPGHVLVVPREPFAQWTHGPSTTATHLFDVARIIGQAQEQAFGVARAGLAIAGFEVPHTHLHVIPLRDEKDILLSRARAASDEELDQAMTALRAALISMGHESHVPASMSSPALS